ncbi:MULTISPECIES: endolytic transglycosylase MltG [unclassified Aureimonas]|uniref:endolytic transglycosylase MltG n=1 Tax=unclassified Aureimonas TaxID=2615206 RepID=UPI0006F7A0F8|nr:MULTISPECIES: endolytic transglycosylase MltG [unclassified Aureimonas]KQT52923.1 4-amino-4-deoxychorismate lyase [Aureimonas sp. Leaf427]KQT80382.1 4-amino-4-deoxychorismate lyase [Aureimonas sp. Leaf460]
MSDETRGGDARKLTPRSATEALRPSAGPVPPRRSRGARNQIVVFFNFLFSAALVILLCAAAIVYWGKTEFEGPGPLTEQASLLVPRSSSLESIASNLERSGIISDARIFEYGVRFSGVAGQLKAGEYGFEPGSSMRDVMEKLQSGSSILYSVAIPEGWTIQQIYDRIGKEEVLTGALPAMVPEGTLRPDTYRVQRGMSRAELVAKMKAAQTELVEEIWARRDADLPVKDVGQFVALASIVEKETGRADERSRVASVFLNRLREGMRLQSDPTVIYGIWGGAGKPADEPIRQSHLKSNTPYNTYVIKGLPPGPIANPGRAALEAVANPSATDDVYFVADGTGGHVFSKTLDEHNANVRRYRQIERERNAAAAAADPNDPIVGE